MNINKVNSLKGTINIPGDKSISHRAIMLGALSRGQTLVSNFLTGADCLSTIDCFKKMGVKIEVDGTNVIIEGDGLHGLKKPDSELFTGNSGTTTRIISGILAGQSFETTLNGDASIQKRPMKRIISPLRMMGANIESLGDNDCTPLKIKGSKLKGIDYKSKIASAQVKSAIIFAGLYADGITTIEEPYVSRNHTEIMLKYFGGDIESKGTIVTVKPEPILTSQNVFVPGDISSAAYFIAAGLIVPNSEILIKNVGINSTRDGILRVCEMMGADITVLNKNNSNGEVTADLLVKSCKLHGTTIQGEIIPTLIDELPIIAVMACLAEGTTIIKDAAELRVKESDRIEVMTRNLRLMGANVIEQEDGMIIEGKASLTGAVVDSVKDHRIAMSFAVAGLCANGTTSITNSECVEISYPNFYKDLQSLCK